MIYSIVALFVVDFCTIWHMGHVEACMVLSVLDSVGRSKSRGVGFLRKTRSDSMCVHTCVGPLLSLRAHFLDERRYKEKGRKGRGKGAVTRRSQT